jgi:hypothetical protein
MQGWDQRVSAVALPPICPCLAITVNHQIIVAYIGKETGHGKKMVPKLHLKHLFFRTRIIPGTVNSHVLQVNFEAKILFFCRGSLFTVNICEKVEVLTLWLYRFSGSTPAMPFASTMLHTLVLKSNTHVSACKPPADFWVHNIIYYEYNKIIYYNITAAAPNMRV